MYAVRIKTNNIASVVNLPDGQHIHIGMREFVNFPYFEIVNPRCLIHNPYCLIVNEEGLLQEKELNYVGSVIYNTQEHGHPLVDDILVMKYGISNGEPNVVGLDTKDIDTVLMAISKYIDGLE